jgi:hypothetical protein
MEYISIGYIFRLSELSFVIFAQSTDWMNIEQLLKVLEERNDNNQAQDFRKERGDLLALVGKDDLMPFAIDRWSDLQHDANEWKMPLLDSEAQSLDNNDVFEETLEDLETSLQNLFDLLPAIRSARQSHLLNLEHLQNALPPKADHFTKVAEEPPAIQTQRIIDYKPSKFELVRKSEPRKHSQLGILEAAVEKNLHMANDLEEAFRMDEEFAKAQGIKDFPIFSPRIHSEAEKLQRHRGDLLRGSDLQIGMEALDAVSKLSTVLQETTKKLILSTESENSTGPAAVPERPQDSEKRIEKLIEVFRHTNSVFEPNHLFT